LLAERGELAYLGVRVIDQHIDLRHFFGCRPTGENSPGVQVAVFPEAGLAPNALDQENSIAASLSLTRMIA
jgi:hypothetical protein